MFSISRRRKSNSSCCIRFNHSSTASSLASVLLSSLLSCSLVTLQTRRSKPVDSRLHCSCLALINRRCRYLLSVCLLGRSLGTHSSYLEKTMLSSVISSSTWIEAFDSLDSDSWIYFVSFRAFRRLGALDLYLIHHRPPRRFHRKSCSSSCMFNGDQVDSLVASCLEWLVEVHMCPTVDFH